MTTMPPTPEHDKLHLVQAESQAIGEFLEWLTDVKQITLAKWDGLGYHDVLRPQYTPIQDLLAEFFGIDQKALEREKRAILAGLS